MQTIVESCQPRPEVLDGELKEEIFAARLKDVIDDNAEDVCGKPEVVFDNTNTYPIAGLKSLLNEALGGLTGQKPTNNPIIRLETTFGRRQDTQLDCPLPCRQQTSRQSAEGRS